MIHLIGSYLDVTYEAEKTCVGKVALLMQYVLVRFGHPALRPFC